MQRIIIIGGGPSGYSAAIRAAQLNNDVVLIEKDALGGTCLNKGCIPTKALLHCSHLYTSIKSGEYGILANDVIADLDKIYSRSNEIVRKLNNGVQSLIKANSIEYHNSQAELLSETAIKLDNGQIIEGDKIVIATGARPAVLPIDGIELSLSSDDILNHNFQNCQNIVIIGGGVIGIEFATFFSELGFKATIIDVMDSILANMTADIAKYVALPLRKKGVKFCLNSTVNSLKKCAEGIITEYTEKEIKKSIVSDIVISCAGRISNSIKGIENTGILFEKGFIVKEDGQTTQAGIYAVGDCVKGNIQLAHYAAADGIRVVEGLSQQRVQPIRTVPSCVYTHPNAAMVGRMEKDCNMEVETGKFNMGANGKTLAEGGAAGFIKVIFDKESQRLIGVEMVCSSACELSGFITNLINNGATRQDILNTVYPHPSVSEGFFEAVEDSLSKSIHTIYKK